MYILAFLSGAVNGLFGCGGGAVCAVLFSKLFSDEKKMFGAMPFFLLPVCAVSLVFTQPKNVYFLPFVCLGGIIGGFLGNFFMKKIKKGILDKIFALLLIILGVKTFL